ncbi:MAG: TlyA family RNA methyltransferase [Actinobacteria bacterium]|nr:TlyA family RNA methyltransferase [Actinomycetota bacterium]
MERLDRWLVDRGYFPSRERARLAIMAGEVEIEGRGEVLKAGTKVRPGDRVLVRSRPRYVSRGGEKLEGALERFGLRVEGRRALDVGSSTGGFTHCLLQRGSSRVVALDVGKGLLHWDLRRDPRVTVMEGRNVRHLHPGDLPFIPDLVVVDLSFISLRKVLSVLRDILTPGGDMLVLVKPQFEAGRAQVGKGGVVRDPEVHREVLREVLREGRKLGLALRGLAPSRPPGADGNREYFAWWSAGGEEGIPDRRWEELIREAVEESLREAGTLGGSARPGRRGSADKPRTSPEGKEDGR